MNNSYDIIIVGAGPAGTSAALYADRLGLKTIILDKLTFPRDKICGDALSGKSVKYMRELGVLDEVPKLRGSTIRRITFGSPSHKQFDIHLSNPQNTGNIKEGYVIPREIFDNFLFEKAQKITEIRQSFNVSGLLYDNGKIVGIKGLQDKEKKEVYAPIILGCDGAKSTIARKLGFHTEDQDNTAIAIRCYYEGVKGLTDQIELHFVDEVLPGYFWLFPAGDNIANIGIGLSKKQAKKDERKLTEILGEVTDSPYFKERFKGSKRLENPKGWSLPLGRIERPNHGDGFMLLGDAAGLVDPFTGEGIGNAMASAKFAIEVSKEAIKKNDFSKKMFSKYHQLVWGELGSELRTSTKLQNLSNYRMLLNIIINKASRNKDIQDIISGMLTKEISKDKLSNPLFYLKVLFS
jgi:geranylgeranyl reductase family protein